MPQGNVERMKPAPHCFGKSVFELLSSMRFAISLLSILAVASIVGTVLKQAEPYNNYLIQLGPFWFEVYEKLGLYDVYHAAWFLLILSFLVVSTSVCITRNAPNFVREMKSFREHVSEHSSTNTKPPPHTRLRRLPSARNAIWKARATKLKMCRAKTAYCSPPRPAAGTVSVTCWRTRPLC